MGWNQNPSTSLFYEKFDYVVDIIQQERKMWCNINQILNDLKKNLLDYYFVITFEIPLKEKMNHSLKKIIKKIKTLITFFLLP